MVFHKKLDVFCGLLYAQNSYWGDLDIESCHQRRKNVFAIKDGDPYPFGSIKPTFPKNLINMIAVPVPPSDGHWDANRKALRVASALHRANTFSRIEKWVERKTQIPPRTKVMGEQVGSLRWCGPERCDEPIVFVDDLVTSGTSIYACYLIAEPHLGCQPMAYAFAHAWDVRSEKTYENDWFQIEYVEGANMAGKTAAPNPPPTPNPHPEPEE